MSLSSQYYKESIALASKLLKHVEKLKSIKLIVSFSLFSHFYSAIDSNALDITLWQLDNHQHVKHCNAMAADVRF